MKTLSLAKFLSTQTQIDRDYFETFRVAVYACMAFFNLNAEWIVILLCFMVADTVFGVVKAFRMGEVISMKTLMWGITSKLCILCVPFLLATMAMVLGENLKFIVDIMVRLLIVNELLSILANIISIKTKKNVKNLDLVSMALNQVRNWFYSFGKKMMADAIPVDEEEKKEND